MKCLRARAMNPLLGLAAATLLMAVIGCQAAIKAQSEPRHAESIPYTTLDELATALADENDVVLVEFCVPSGCSRCDQMRESIDRMATDQQEWLTVRRVDLRQHLQLMVELNLNRCPSYVAFHDGEEVFRAASPTSADLIASGIDSALNNYASDQLVQTNL